MGTPREPHECPRPCRCLPPCLPTQAASSILPSQPSTSWLAELTLKEGTYCHESLAPVRHQPPIAASHTLHAQCRATCRATRRTIGRWYLFLAILEFYVLPTASI